MYTSIDFNNCSQGTFDSDYTIIEILILHRKYEEAFHTIRTLLNKVKYDDDSYIHKLLQLQGHCESVDDSRYCSYSAENVSNITTCISKNKTEPINSKSITITMTCCKRIDLFIPTVNSFLACCKDLGEHVYEWIAVDDNSSDADRKKMQELYPFIRFIFKTPEQKGHAKSMNILLDIIKTPHIFHLEDDWRFFIQDTYLEKCLQVLDDNVKLGQCLLNKNYSEDIATFGAYGGGYRRYTPQGLRYYIHEHLTVDSLKNYKFDKPNSTYWPHYSLRPGITKKSALDAVGKYSEDAGHFEMDYANKYKNAGYITAYLDNIYCTHIGRRTYERASNIQNAYDMNSEKQFGIESANSKSGSDTDIKTSIKTYVLNLNRRPDRLKKFQELNDKQFINYNIFQAIDGMKLTPCHNIQRLFEKNDYKYRRGIVGCALSHLLMWRDLLDIKSNGLIIEDDAVLTPDFMAKVLHLITSCPDADIIFLGHHPYEWADTPLNKRIDILPTAEKWSLERCMRDSAGGTTAYYITLRGIYNLMSYINSNSITNGIDWVMFKTANINNIYYCSPHLAFADFAQITTNPDTDIQNCYDGVGYASEIDWIKDEISFWGEKGIKNFKDYPELEDSKSSILYYDDICCKGDLITHVCMFKNTNPNKIKIWLYPVNCYSVGKYMVTVPENMVTDETLKNITFGGHLNSFNMVSDSIKKMV